MKISYLGWNSGWLAEVFLLLAFSVYNLDYVQSYNTCKLVKFISVVCDI